MKKEITLLKLTLRNFKGIRDYVLNPDEANVSVFGDNAAGKTTLFDAFVWLLFDKDSQNKKDFEIKTLDAAGKVFHKLEHEVEGVLVVNGKRITLRKVFAEKWSKKRGSATEEFSGHTTDYFINGVPAKKAEYDEAVNGIVNENIFKLLTNPMFFNEQLKWQERRKILLEVCGDVADSEVIESNKSLASLPAILGDRSIEDHRKVIAARRSKINEELEKIPIRIDEVYRSMPQPDGEKTAIEERIKLISRQIEDKQAELTRLQSGGEIAVKEKRQHELEGELLQLKNELQAGTMDKVNVKRQEVSRLRTELETIRFNRTKLGNKIASNNEMIGSQEDKAANLRSEWNEVNAETFQHHHDENCPSCGQSLPADQLEASHDKALATFNLRKSERLEQITAKGKAAAGEAKRLKEENAAHARDLETLDQQIAAKERELSAAESDLTNMQSGITDVDTDPRYLSKKEEIAAVKSEILYLRSSLQGAIEETRLSLARLRTDLEMQEKHKASFALIAQSEERIADLNKQEKELAAEFERLEGELYLTEEFIRTNVALLEAKINSKFKFARFKLFDQQINGGVAECCETTFKGVPYGSGLNNGARINIGLDIINTLSEHYGVTAPIFVDNAESVTRLIETNGQQICLIVSEKDKQLRVEDGVANMKEAV